LLRPAWVDAEHTLSGERSPASSPPGLLLCSIPVKLLHAPLTFGLDLVQHSSFPRRARRLTLDSPMGGYLNWKNRFQADRLSSSIRIHGGWHVRGNSSRHFAGWTDRRMACGTGRMRHWLRTNCRHRDRRCGSLDRELVAASPRHPSWIWNRSGDHWSYHRRHSLAFDSQAGLSSRPLVIKSEGRYGCR
jgi:hypothetical protein